MKMNARLLHKQRPRRRVRERAVALFMVLGSLAMMVILLSEFQSETSSEIAAATAARDAVQAEYMARSAIHLSRLLIASEPTIRTALAPLFMLMRRSPTQLPIWQFSDQFLGAFNGQTDKQNFSSSFSVNFDATSNLGMKNGSFEVDTVDEDSKINANLGGSNEIAHIRLAKELMGLMSPVKYDPLFQQVDGRGQSHDRMAICQAVIDWADSDENAYSCDVAASTTGATAAGTEDAYYQLLKKPYRRKNAPYDSLEELRMVRGVGDDFWANFVEPEPNNPAKRVMTVWSQGLVNVNSASPQTLLGVVCSGAPSAEICVDMSQASTFLMGVTMARGISMGAPLFGSPQEFIQMMTGKGMLGPILVGLGMKPVKFQSESEFGKSISTESKVFSIYAIGIKKGYKRETRVRVHAVVDFRSAPSLPAGPVATASNSRQLTSPSSSAPTSSVRTTQGDDSSSALISALSPSAGGQILYFRVE